MRKITNRGSVEVSVCGHRHTVESNTTEIAPLRFEVTQTTPCNFVLEHGLCHYEFRVRNRSEVAINECMFRNPLQNGVEFVRESFRIDGRRAPVRVQNHVIEARLSTLRPCATQTITFDTRVGSFEGESPCDDHHHHEHCDRCHRRDEEREEQEFVGNFVFANDL
jgi:uncharacterized repeat protein (TIGR01451 family)